MQYPISTGQAARMLGITEPRLAELVRRGKVKPEPLVMAGRRLWEPSHIRMAAEALGLPVDGVQVLAEGRKAPE